MSTLKLVRLSDSMLHQRAKPVDPQLITQRWFQNELDALVAAMHEYHGVGLAAVQVGINKQIFVCEVNQNSRYPDAPRIPLQIYINPQITEQSEETNDMQEGCLSVPTLRASVPRSNKVTLTALDREGKSVTIHAEGFLARIFQHECDHLGGRVFLERVREFSTVVRNS